MAESPEARKGRHERDQQRLKLLRVALLDGSWPDAELAAVYAERWDVPADQVTRLIGVAREQIERRRTKEGRDERIEQVRNLLNHNFPKGDIKRLLARKWGVKPRRVEAYIARAKARNRDYTGDTAEESRAGCIGFWQNRQRQAMERESEAKAELVRLRAEERELEGVLDAITRGKQDGAAAMLRERKEVALLRLKSCRGRINQLYRTLWSSGEAVEEKQVEIQKLRGDYAPQKVAKTDAAGHDVPVVTEPSEPVDPDRALSDLLTKVESRMTPGVN